MTPADLDRLGERWREAIDAELPAAVALRHELHAAPDVSGAEEPTTRRVVEAIRAGWDGTGRDGAGPDGETGAGPLRAEVVAGTGRLLRCGPDGAAVGLRAELDALPVREQTGAAFASTTGAMHACGHDVHLAALAAVVRAARGLELPLGLVALLQPREELGPTGATDIVAAGVLPEHHVRALVAAHVQPQVPAGHVGADAGPVNASVDEVEIVVTGRGGHSGYPHLAVDPVATLCRVVLALPDTVRSAVAPQHPTVVMMTQLEGAGAPNVIPGVARAAGTVRAMREQDRWLLHDRIARTVERTAAAQGCKGEYVVRRGEPALLNDARLAEATRRRLERFGVPTAPFASCGSDDFATYGPQLPILMQFVGTGDGTDSPMLHTPAYLPGDHVVGEAATALLAGWLAAAEVTLG